VTVLALPSWLVCIHWRPCIDWLITAAAPAQGYIFRLRTSVVPMNAPALVVSSVCRWRGAMAGVPPSYLGEATSFALLLLWEASFRYA
jgi:hypothetical protein